MKVGFIGPGGTGKTTTARLIKTDLQVIDSVARDVFKEFNMNEADQWKKSPREVLKLQTEIFARKTRQELEFSSGLFDRTLLDSLMYILLTCHPVISDADVTAWEKTTNKVMETYDLLFYFPIDHFPSPEDDIRKANLAYRKLQDLVLRGYIGKFDLDPTWVRPGTPEERARLIQQKIELHR